MDNSREQITGEVLQAYMTLTDQLRLAGLPSWIAASMSLTQLKAMFLLEYYGALTVSALARSLETSNSAASILIQQLVEQELVERSEDAQDRRRTLVRLTARGATLVAGRRDHIKNHLGRWLGQIDEASLACLLRGFNALVAVMQKEQGEREKSLE